MGTTATWQQYLETQLTDTGNVNEALMIGKQDAAVWAGTPEFLPRQYEGVVTQDDGTEAKQTINEAVILVTIAQTLRKPAEGLRCNGVKYMPVRTYPNGSADDGLATMYFKKPKGGGCLVVTNQSLILGTFDEAKGQTGAACNYAVEALGRYLYQAGY
ncbi:Profilin [Hondaea fermentalgiana]|uniref:Profilin n=1 Tax=Hondaea fermentalgiana TaxID=2315210 RepID=A0A2R5G5Y6_9STRA|nr:Profilin [Hondaea fermentalgiana]|eukprot:GBG25945.1 Profilin [Hondaea fermentalgiana]